MPETDARAAPTPALAEIGFGIGVLILAAVVGWQTSLIPPVVYAKVSPSLAPWGVTLALTVLGALLLVAGLRGGWEHERGWQLDWRALAWLGFGMLFNLRFIEGLDVGDKKVIPAFGFIICSVVLFTCVARAFGSRKLVRDLLIAFVFATVAYAGFDGILGYKIGAGGLDPIVSSVIDTIGAAVSSKGAR
jgi:putative tricarboxylic transport membrane protein